MRNFRRGLRTRAFAPATTTGTFELAYTDRSDRGLANYIRDVIEAAAAEGALSREEAQALPWLPRGGDGCNF